MATEGAILSGKRTILGQGFGKSLTTEEAIYFLENLSGKKTELIFMWR